MDETTHILLVEDEPALLTSLSLILEMEGYRVTGAGNGQEALQALEEGAPNLVITDFAMPYLNGYQLIEAIREHEAWRHLPVLLVSAALPSVYATKHRADEVLNKPFDIDALLDVAERLIIRS